MENKKAAPATQQPISQQHLMAHHVHPDQIYSPQPPAQVHHAPAQPAAAPPNGVMHHLIQSQYHSNTTARSPLLENRHDVYSTGYTQDYARHYGANDNYNYPQSPPRDLYMDHNVNHELLHNMPKGYNAEVYQDYLKRNPPKDTNQIYQNHQPMYMPNMNQYGSKPYLPYSNRIGPQSNTELLRRQYNEIQQMKLQQQMHYQNQAQMQQQQKFAERQLLLQQIHGVQPPPNLQNSIYSDGSYRDLDQYSSKNDFKEYSSTDIQKDIDRYAKNNEYKDTEKQTRQYQESQWPSNQQTEMRDIERYRKQSEGDKGKCQSPPEFNNQSPKNNVGVVSPMKSSESSSPSVKSPSSDSRRSSGGNQALRSPIAQRVPSAPVTLAGILYKQGSDGLKVWRKRWFVLSEYCLFYYKSQDEEKLLGSVLLPSYKVSACSAEDKVLRKFAFKLEHANMRTYVLAAPDQDAMMKWVKALTMAALMQSSNEQPQKQSERAAAKTEDGDEVPGPTYANAPPKPRRSNEGYNSPSPDMYDPNYDLLKKPASHYSQGTSHMRHQDHTNYQTSPNQESTYSCSPQSPPPPAQQQQPQYQTKRSYDTHHLSLPLTNTITDRIEHQNPSTSSLYRSNPQSPYFDNRNRGQQQSQAPQENNQEQIYERQVSRNPFLQDLTPQGETPSKESERTKLEEERAKALFNDCFGESRANAKSNVDINSYNREVYGELNTRSNRAGSSINERLLIERRTPDAYGRSTTMSAYNNKGKAGDYEDVYASYATESEYGKTYAQSPPDQRQTRDATSISSQQQPQDYAGNYSQEKTFSGPSVLRRKKMQSSGIQPPMPRPHSADFLEYESKNEMLNKTMPPRTVCDPPRQPQRPKSSLDINSYYDPSSDRYYSEESYAEKMRQSAQYLQHGMSPRNIQIPLAKYASGLAEKQLNSPYSQIANNNYETEFGITRTNRDNLSYNSKYSDLEGLNSNWTLKEKENQKDYLNRSGSVMSDNSNAGGFAKDLSRFESPADGFIRSASARLPSTTTEKEGEKKVQQREESMKRLLEWKQRMLQSPLTRKSTPAAISLARSLNQSRQSLRSDQYKPKTYTNASYNSYSSDDEEEASGTDLLKPRDMQAGRSNTVNLTSPIIMRPITPHAPAVAQVEDKSKTENKFVEATENTYENILCTINVPKIKLEQEEEINCTETQEKETDKAVENIEKEIDEGGYETHDSEGESETQMEYTDNDLDEVLLESDTEVQNVTDNVEEKQIKEESNVYNETIDQKRETPPARSPGEDHYLPMSPRKISTIEPAHKTILQNLSVFDQSMPQGYEDNPYVEMNIGNEEEDMQTYEIVCVNNGKVEPVYMELSNVTPKEKESEDVAPKTKFLLDTASNFADTKDHTLKRASKGDRTSKERFDCSDADDEASKDISLDTPFSRFSISDTFRPASYYLSSSRNITDMQDSSDSEILPPPPIPSSSPPCEELSDEALSKYILEKLDKSDMSQDNSILKMLTSENQKMNTVKRKTTSLMIYGSRTSIHDTLSRGEKIRNSRASLTNDRKLNDTPSNLLNNSIFEQYNSSSIETDSLQSYNADRGSSRLSLESDISSKFEMVPSNMSSEVTSLNESEPPIDFRYSTGFKDVEMMIKRRPLSDDSIFELAASDISGHNDLPANVDLDMYLDNLQPSTSDNSGGRRNLQLNISANDASSSKDTNMVRAAHLQTVSHMRCSSTPVSHTNKINSSEIGAQYRNINEQMTGYIGSQSSCSSVGIPKSPISYYCKTYDEEKLLSKNLNSDVLADKIKEFEGEKLALKSGNETNASSTTTGFHSRESSTEHSAPYYYSDLSSQEHINLLPTSHYLKNTNLHRKLNNQRRRGPLHKKNEISHIHNPIRNNQLLMSDRSFDLAASARSVSVEFLSAADKDPEIDLKNIYESTGTRNSKIPESMNLISGLGCKRNSSNNSNIGNSSPDSNSAHRNSLNASSSIKVSNASMSSHCSGNSSNTVYYDAEAEACAYENVVSQGEKHWDEDSLWRDNLRRVSHRHARSMDDLDAVPAEAPLTGRTNVDTCGMNSIKRVKKNVTTKISRNVTYVNCDIQSQVLRRRENTNFHNSCPEEEEEKVDDNDVYVSLAEDVQKSIEHSDEGVYEQLAVESSDNSLTMQSLETNKYDVQGRNRRKFEIDREKLRQWDLMSSGLMKGGAGRVRGVCAGVGTGAGDVLGSTDTGTDSASNEGIL
ncbi:uncharacterized protein LOC126379948 isoform X1 [Pectinophora gossypiella]|uniref:uncharacterized protein LOC126379948 isoform X1 n=1 Tax=Pectinophora gossypiella TaxID=13191 RepID=UPI00214F4CAF|nr:uncharacterized protein LOC126379948 isoform X1 [Pectinophora gossypiella]XP_049884928.1 uncharacterized protein LOC126379948 isoform X1 [Pectinophora gossypiella]